MTRITEQLADLKGRIALAAERAGRNPADIRIVAVSKKQSPDAVREARDAGLRHFGENYLQEALRKISDSDDDLVWHFIGRVQSNKTRQIAEHFDWVHTLDKHRTAERLSAQRPGQSRDLQVCIQVRSADAAALDIEDRNGIVAAGVPKLADIIRNLPRIRLRGLMMMPLPGQSEDNVRQEYSRTRELLEDLQRQGHEVDTLSMGMSSDIEAAIMEGSTLLRIGTALFGPRHG